MARSKSPAPRKAAAKAAPAPDAADYGTLAITVVAVLGVWYFSGAKFEGNIVKDFSNHASLGFKVEYPSFIQDILGSIPVLGTIIQNWIGTGFNFVLLMHCINTIRSESSGYWLNSFTQCVIATYAGKIVIEIMKGTSMADAIFSDDVPNLFFLWYVINKDIPFCPVNLNIWGQIEELGGEPLQDLLDLGSELFSTGLIIQAVGAATTVFSGAWFKSIAMGAIAGTASNFFPFNKGVKFARSEALSNAVAVSFFVASDGFKVIDYFVTEFITNTTALKNPEIGSWLNENLVNSVGSGAADFVVLITIVNLLFGHILRDLIPCPAMKKGFDMFGIVDFVFEKAQMS